MEEQAVVKSCTNEMSAECACLPVCYRLCPACSGEMCSGCDFMGIVRCDPVAEGGNIFVHQHPSDGDPGLAQVLMMCRESLLVGDE